MSITGLQGLRGPNNAMAYTYRECIQRRPGTGGDVVATQDGRGTGAVRQTHRQHRLDARGGRIVVASGVVRPLRDVEHLDHAVVHEERGALAALRLCAEHLRPHAQSRVRATRGYVGGQAGPGLKRKERGGATSRREREGGVMRVAWMGGRRGNSRRRVCNLSSHRTKAAREG
eukprot:6173809-Pleurochrysis_carterae.AAC.1